MRPAASGRLARVFASRPYAVAGVTIVLLLLMWDTGRTVVGDDVGGRSRLDLVVVGCLVYAGIVVLYLSSRVYAPRAASRGRDAIMPVLNFAFATSPFLIAYALWFLGADTWSVTVALTGSAVLVLQNDYATRR